MVSPEKLSAWIGEVLEVQCGLSVAPTEGGPDEGLGYLATVEISGGSRCRVVLWSHLGLARRVALAMFGTDPFSLEDEWTRDAVGEILNIVAGMVKASLPGPSNLSVPVVEEQEVPWEAPRGIVEEVAVIDPVECLVRVAIVEAEPDESR